MIVIKYDAGSLSYRSPKEQYVVSRDHNRDFTLYTSKNYNFIKNDPTCVQIFSLKSTQLTLYFLLDTLLINILIISVS
jgi:hypothetical protein